MTNALRLGVAGLGTVGTGLLEIVAKHGAALAVRAGTPIAVSEVTARDRNKERGVDLSAYTWAASPHAMATSDDVDVFVELMGGEGDPAKSAVEAALKAGKHVVTANKALLAMHGNELAKLAEENQVALNFEAAVAGGIPIVKTIRESATANQISRVYGIMNGTCNFIMTKMRDEARDFADVLAEAQELGYAEADPTFDIGGFDAAHKLAILTSLAFGREIDFSAMYVEGIEHIALQDITAADNLGYKIKLLGVAVETDDGIEQRVHPTLVPKGSNIAEVEGVFNAVGLEGDSVGELILEGAGAGAGPTASAVMADVVDIARGNIVPPLGLPAAMLKPYKRARMRAHEGGYYIALELFDRPGEVASVAQHMADHNISLESIMQHTADKAERGTPRETAPFIIITHDTMESDVRAALEQIEKGGHLASKPRVIRIERF